MLRPIRTFVLPVAFALLALARPAAAQVPPAVDVELVLAVDVSWSMDIDEQQLQREGYVAALRDPEVIATIARGDYGVIALAYVEWAGVGLERIIVPWTIVADAADADAFAQKLEAAPIGRLRRTSISSAITFSAAMFDNGIDGMRNVVDVSGDGPNNMGPVIVDARDAALAQGITINGLPIMIKRSRPGEDFQIEDLDTYYEDCVIGGFGAFMITITDPSQFREAIRRKLILEIAGVEPVPRIVPVQFGRRAARIDCEVGEKQYRRWRSIDDW